MNQWICDIKNMLIELTEKNEVPIETLFLSENKDKNGTDIISYTICIWEPSYPPIKDEKQNASKQIITITPSTAKSRPDDLDLFLRENQSSVLLDSLPEDAEVLQKTESDKVGGAVRVRFKRSSSGLISFLRKVTEYAISTFESKADSFGCCSLYLECSDAKKCLHENKLYSKACIYRSNLDSGKIFYGKNKNVE